MKYYLEKRKKMGKPHELHRHRLLEHKFSLSPDKCIVDAEFSYMFSEGIERVEYDNGHIIVSRSEYMKIESLLSKLDTSYGCSHEHFQRYLMGLLPGSSDANSGCGEEIIIKTDEYMDREKTFKVLKNRKIYVDGQLEKVYRKLLEAGFSWGQSFSALDAKTKGYPFVYTDEQRISLGADMKAFTSDPRLTLKVEELLSMGIEVTKPIAWPFQKVLVRDSVTNWTASFFSHLIPGELKFVSVGGAGWEYCIPYKGNEDLIETKKEPKVTF